MFGGHRDRFSESLLVARKDTSKLRRVALPEVAVVGVKSVQFIGLGRLKHNFGYRGTTGDRIAVYIAHPAAATGYQVTAAVLDVSKQHASAPGFEEGELRIRLCRATDADHPPLDSLLAPEWIVAPESITRKNQGYLELSLAAPVILPQSGLYVVAAWHYRRSAKDEKTRAIRSAELAATWDVPESYTWTSIGDLRQTWQREGDKNSITEIIHRQGVFPQWKDKVCNALLGVKVKQVE
jgi:hypothetical protein